VTGFYQLPILFAHRGGRAHEAENSLAAFHWSLRKGIGGLESDARLTADKVCVLAHDSGYWHKGMRRRIAARTLAQLPGSLLSLASLYETLGCDFEFSLDIKAPGRWPLAKDLATETARAAVACATAVEQQTGQPAVARLWLCHFDWELLASWRQLWPEVKLVNSVRLDQLKEGPERRAAQLADAGVNVLNMPHTDWTKGFVALVHRFAVLAFGWDAHQERVIAELLSYGIDGIYGDNVDRLLEATR